MLLSTSFILSQSAGRFSSRAFSASEIPVGRPNCCLWVLKENLGKPGNFGTAVKLQNTLRTVPTIVIAHTFCASQDTRISYR